MFCVPVMYLNLCLDFRFCFIDLSLYLVFILAFKFASFLIGGVHSHYKFPGYFTCLYFCINFKINFFSSKKSVDIFIVWDLNLLIDAGSDEHFL